MAIRNPGRCPGLCACWAFSPSLTKSETLINIFNITWLIHKIILSLQTENYSLKLNTLFYELTKQWIQPFPTLWIWHRYSSRKSSWYLNFSCSFCIYCCRIYHYRHRITGYRPALAKKVIDNVPTIAAKGLTRQDAEDFVTIFEATGATASVVAM